MSGVLGGVPNRGQGEIFPCVEGGIYRSRRRSVVVRGHLYYTTILLILLYYYYTAGLPFFWLISTAYTSKGTTL